MKSWWCEECTWRWQELFFLTSLLLSSQSVFLLLYTQLASCCRPVPSQHVVFSRIVMRDSDSVLFFTQWGVELIAMHVNWLLLTGRCSHAVTGHASFTRSGIYLLPSLLSLFPSAFLHSVTILDSNKWEECVSNLEVWTPVFLIFCQFRMRAVLSEEIDGQKECTWHDEQQLLCCCCSRNAVFGAYRFEYLSDFRSVCRTVCGCSVVCLCCVKREEEGWCRLFATSFRD